MLLLIVIVVCLILIGRAHYLSLRHKEQQGKLREMREAQQENSFAEEEKTSEEVFDAPTAVFFPVYFEEESGEAEPVEEEPVMLSQYTALYEENNDLAGWLSIEGTVIDYPVMQGVGKEEDYYLRRDFYGNADMHGCLYVRERGNIENGTNFIIYGHYMGDKTMFGTLDSYLKESFFLEHPTISFDTLYEERTYEIMAVFRSKVYYSEEDVFKYYQFYEAETEEEFDYFYENVKELSLYDTGVTAVFGDTFLTLSTCSYHVEDGRFVVVAKRTDSQNF